VLSDRHELVAGLLDGVRLLPQALLTLAHESIHLQQATAGAVVPADSLVESQAECSGMQWTARVAEQFGDSPDDAQSIADYFWLAIRLRRGHPMPIRWRVLTGLQTASRAVRSTSGPQARPLGPRGAIVARSPEPATLSPDRRPLQRDLAGSVEADVCCVSGGSKPAAGALRR
jgi:hypothetical protein